MGNDGGGSVPMSMPYQTWRVQNQNNDSAKGAIMMELLRKFISLYAAVDNSFAMELAGTFLDLDCGLAELPLWLTDLLTGSRNSSSFGTCRNDVDGTTPGHGFNSTSASDPAGLVRLLMNRGLYIQACRVVCSVLRKASNDASLLPEKGNIDYVPYDTIDRLW